MLVSEWRHAHKRFLRVGRGRAARGWDGGVRRRDRAGRLKRLSRQEQSGENLGIFVWN